MDFINDENPTNYDYPVPNIVALPVSNGNPEYLSWVKSQCSTDAGKIKYDPEDKNPAE